MGFIATLFGSENQQLTAAELQAIRRWPAFKPDYSDRPIAEARVRRSGNNERYVPLYATDKIDPDHKPKLEAEMSVIGAKLDVTIVWDEHLKRFQMMGECFNKLKNSINSGKSAAV